jgi:hypothetical protein
MLDTEPVIDFSLIAFPTDRLSVQDMRRLYPHGFDLTVDDDALGEIREGTYYRRRSLDVILGDLVDVEREVAERAFYRALGGHRPDRLCGNPDEAVLCLVNGYIQFGLASGEHHVDQLVRDIENQATAQAHRFLGRS